MAQTHFRVVGPERGDEWLTKGHKLRHFFAHRLFHLPKCGPDGYRIGQAMWGLNDLGAHWQLLLYAGQQLLDDLPAELFFDDDVIWHQQHFERPGQVATASLIIESGVLYTAAHHADLVQRVGRFREHKTQVEKRFAGWPWMLLNGVLAFAQERGIGTVRIPGSRLAMRHTDRMRVVQPYLFERVYDRPPADLPGVTARGDYWEIETAQATAAAVLPTRASEPMAEEKVVCVFHDLERGLGHVREDPELARRATIGADETLEAMLGVEARAGTRVTYNVVGQLLGSVREQIESGRHALAFHSFDHGERLDQLLRCREQDYRLKGYRLPRSQLTDETTDEHLAFHNFEWLASSRSSNGHAAPALSNRLVRIPVSVDDFALYLGTCSYEEWEQRVLALVQKQAFTAIGLHDCYADRWLAHYPALLEKLSSVARLRTIDEVSADLIMAAAA